LTKPALAAAEAFYRKASDIRARSNELSLLGLPGSVPVGEWNNFDQVYLYLHRMAVIDHLFTGTDGAAFRDTNFFSHPAPERLSETDWDEETVSVEYLLNINLTINSPERPFISEFEVRALMDFRNSFSQHLEFDNFIEFLNLGCVELTFAVKVPVPPEYSDPTIRHSFTKKTVDERLSSPYWVDLQNRFNVSEQHVK